VCRCCRRAAGPVRYTWFVDETEPRFEPAFFGDGGRIWATNWVTTQVAADRASAAARDFNAAGRAPRADLELLPPAATW
jgi:hypothetical protein